MALISLSDIKLAFGGPPLFDGINLQIETGDRLCLMGRNGTGKSTLLKVISGLLQPEGGQISRQQGVNVSFVSQDVPLAITGSVFDVVSKGKEELCQLLSEYHHLAHHQNLLDDPKLFSGFEKIQRTMEERGAWSLHQDVERILQRLELDADADFSSLSGGTKRRVMLAQALISNPDILLLDEPTNHLDISTIIWLEEFLFRQVKTCIFVTHDRAFARKLANRVAEIDRGRLYSFNCSYDQFVVRREALLEAEISRQALFDKKLAAEEAWIRQGIKARRTRNEGRVRALKVLREQHRQRRERQGNARIQMQEADRSGALVAELEGVTFGYGETPILKDVSTTIMRGDKIGIIGANGSGKTTLLRLILGELQPQSGKINLGTRREVLYFDQLREQLDLDGTVQENVGGGNDTITINGKPRHVIGYLQDFLFSPERARTPVRILSGGERNRLLLAKLFTKRSNVLVMDEPTNDLDAETLDLLDDLLVEYNGTLLLVSHDRQFINNVVTSTLVVGDDGTVREYIGGYDDWLEQVAKDAEPATASKSNSTPSTKEKPAKERPRKLSFKEKRELESLPDEITALEDEQESLHKKLSDPEFYKRTGGETARINSRLGEIEERLRIVYERWNELETRKNLAGESK